MDNYQLIIERLTADTLEVRLQFWGTLPKPGYFIEFTTSMGESFYTQIQTVESVALETQQLKLTLTLIAGNPDIHIRQARYLSPLHFYATQHPPEKAIIPYVTNDHTLDLNELGHVVCIETKQLRLFEDVLKPFETTQHPILILDPVGIQPTTLNVKRLKLGQDFRLSIQDVGINTFVQMITANLPPVIQGQASEFLLSLVPPTPDFIPLKYFVEHPAFKEHPLSSAILHRLYSFHTNKLFASAPEDAVPLNTLEGTVLVDFSEIPPNVLPHAYESLLNMVLRQSFPDKSQFVLIAPEIHTELTQKALQYTSNRYFLISNTLSPWESFVTDIWQQKRCFGETGIHLSGTMTKQIPLFISWESAETAMDINLPTALEATPHPQSTVSVASTPIVEDMAPPEPMPASSMANFTEDISTPPLPEPPPEPEPMIEDTSVETSRSLQDMVNTMSENPPEDELPAPTVDSDNTLEDETAPTAHLEAMAQRLENLEPLTTESTMEIPLPDASSSDEAPTGETGNLTPLDDIATLDTGSMDTSFDLNFEQPIDSIEIDDALFDDTQTTPPPTEELPPPSTEPTEPTPMAAPSPEPMADAPVPSETAETNELSSLQSLADSLSDMDLDLDNDALEALPPTTTEAPPNPDIDLDTLDIAPPSPAETAEPPSVSPPSPSAGDMDLEFDMSPPSIDMESPTSDSGDSLTPPDLGFDLDNLDLDMEATLSAEAASSNTGTQPSESVPMDLSLDMEEMTLETPAAEPVELSPEPVQPPPLNVEPQAINDNDLLLDDIQTADPLPTELSEPTQPSVDDIDDFNFDLDLDLGSIESALDEPPPPVPTTPAEPSPPIAQEEQLTAAVDSLDGGTSLDDLTLDDIQLDLGPPLDDGPPLTPETDPAPIAPPEVKPKTMGNADSGVQDNGNANFEVGETVAHQKYGQGTIKRIIRMDGGQVILNIIFDGVGKRLLDPNLTQLEKVV